MQGSEKQEKLVGGTIATQRTRLHTWRRLGLGNDNHFRRTRPNSGASHWHPERSVDMPIVDLLRLCILAWNSLYFLPATA